jgi:hypothetical protein
MSISSTTANAQRGAVAVMSIHVDFRLVALLYDENPRKKTHPTIEFVDWFNQNIALVFVTLCTI